MNITETQKEIIRNIIYAVETGGHEYGNKNYNCFIEAGTNTDNETAITIGAGQFHAANAQRLLKAIREADPALFKSLDNAGIGKDIDNANWNTYKLSKGSYKAKCIQKLIDTEVAHRIQDELMDEDIAGFMKDAENLGVTSISSQAMCANFTHHGGFGATKRIVNRAKEKYNSTELDYIYKACQADSQPNQVGTYKSRQSFVYTNLKERIWPDEQDTNNTVVDEISKQETATEEKVPVKEQPKQEIMSTNTVTVDLNKKKIIEAQNKLNSLFEQSLEVDGDWGPISRQAYIKAVQIALNKSYSEGLLVDGDFGPKTLAAINRHSLKKGMKNIYVKVLQIGLYAHEISLVGGIDGEYGESTFRGVQAFQSKVHITCDGVAGGETFTYIIKK